jgi:hypothetical protein
MPDVPAVVSTDFTTFSSASVGKFASFVFSVEVKTLFVFPSYIKSALNLLELLIRFCLVVSLGCLWSPLANLLLSPTEAVPSIKGVEVDASEPGGISEDFAKP